MKLSKHDWVNAKRRYIYTDISYSALASDVGMGRQGMMAGFKRIFPKVDFQKRKEEERIKREAIAAERQAEKRVGQELQATAVEDSITAANDVMDSRHLEFITLAFDKAIIDLRNGVLKAKDIKDIKDLVNLERLINNKRTTNDRVIVIKAERPDVIDSLPEIIDAEFEEV